MRTGPPADLPIEKIAVGDKVLARDSQSGKMEFEPVTALVPKHPGKLLEIRVEGEPGALRPSFGHPFWAKLSEIDSGHWIEASSLKVGELLETIDGDWRRIVSIAPVEREETVNNFTVAKDHDYFVGQTGFLVHNKTCGCRLPDEDIHHIVARNDPRADFSRIILGMAGIGVNSDGNLVNLLRDFHQRLHTDEYFEAVERKLLCGLQSGGPGAIQGVLDDISEQLGNGTWIPQ